MKTTLPSEIIELDLDQIDWTDTESVKALFQKLLNVIENLTATVAQLQEENQQLKGEKRTPKTSSESSGGERKRPPESKKWRKGSKKGKVKIDRTVVCRVDKSLLPPDAEFKGYRSVVKQNIKIQTDNVKYRLEQWYSKSEGKLYEASLPADAPKGEFDSDLEALVMCLNHLGRMPYEKIREFLADVEVEISKGQITNILTKTKQDDFTREREDIYKAGMRVSDVVHTDSTGIKHKGEPHHIHILCNKLFSHFSIEKYKDRPTLRKLLRMPDGVLRYIILVADDAKQYLHLCVVLSLCWLHEIRHYKKLKPVLQAHKKEVGEKLDQIWKYYFALREYKEWACKGPPPLAEKLKRQQELEERFNAIFTTPASYGALDHRLSLTAAKKERLLVPLYHPHVPLHNNDAERPLREPVIRRRISGGTKSEEGRQAWENILTIRDTCRKHGVSFYHYLFDIISGNREMIPLSTRIRVKGTSLPITF